MIKDRLVIRFKDFYELLISHDNADDRYGHRADNNGGLLVLFQRGGESVLRKILQCEPGIHMKIFIPAQFFYSP